MDGARSILQRLSEAAEIDVDHPKHDYLAPHVTVEISFEQLAADQYIGRLFHLAVYI
jgi:hypothetical protein